MNVLTPLTAVSNVTACAVFDGRGRCVERHGDVQEVASLIDTFSDLREALAIAAACEGPLALGPVDTAGWLYAESHAGWLMVNHIAAISHQSSSDAPGAASDLSQARTGSRCNRLEHPVNRLEGARAESAAVPKREPDAGEKWRLEDHWVIATGAGAAPEAMLRLALSIIGRHLARGEGTSPMGRWSSGASVQALIAALQLYLGADAESAVDAELSSLGGGRDCLEPAAWGTLVEEVARKIPNQVSRQSFTAQVSMISAEASSLF